MELYVHVPFCVKKCAYCDFLSFPKSSVETAVRDAYTAALCNEISSYRKAFAQYGCESIFIGGGTPSVLDDEALERVLKAVCGAVSGGAGNDSCPDVPEYTVEVNPGTVTKEKLLLMRRYGVNRISFGLQSADDEELKTLGRIHTYRDFLESYALARECGFQNINVDLISAIPGQTPESWEKNLRTVAELKPEHISAYSLIIEPGTPFYEWYLGDGVSGPFYGNTGDEGEAGDGTEPSRQYKPLPSEDEEREMYRATGRILSEYGYGRYEISNYAKPSYESKHNLGYWTGIPYAGCGLGASSYMDVNGKMTRFKNSDCFEAYNRDTLGTRTVEDILDADGLMSEYMILHLRLTKGFLKEEFARRFNKDVYEVYGQVIEKYKRYGLLKDENGYIALTEDGLDLSNTVMSEFV